MLIPTSLGLVSLIVVGASLGAAEPSAELVRPTDPLPAEAEAAGFHLRPGFSIQLFASEPMINKPINLAFDAKGRMWVSSTVEYPYPAAKERWSDAQGTRVKDSRDAIKILEDTNGDGRADRVTDFVDGLNIPIGVLPYGRGCIAWSIPNIWLYEDVDGDGRCDSRKILFGPLGYEKDTHGNISSLTLGRDGWVYATHGFSNTSHFETRPENRKPGAPLQTLDLQSGSVFRFRPDGSEIELWSRGQVNPFGLAFDSWGALYTADCHSNPLTQNIRGAYYPSFGKLDDGLGFGPVMCRHTHASTGLCGLVYLDANVWGPEWNERTLLGNVVTSRINTDRTEFKGSTPEAAEEPDFLTTDDLWFRPVNLQLGPEGALYIADFYNKVIGHYEVPLTHPGRDRERGRIWRIVKEGAGAKKSPSAEAMLAAEWRWQRGSRAAWTAEDEKDALALISEPQTAPRLRRIVAEGLTGHPSATLVVPLYQAWESAPVEDVSLRHTLLRALQASLRLPGAFPSPAGYEEEAPLPALLTQIARTLTTPEASVWLLADLRRSAAPSSLEATLNTLARTLPAAETPALITLAREKFSGSLTAQLGWIASLQQGAAQRGEPAHAALSEWANELIPKILTGTPEQGFAAEGEPETFGPDRRTTSAGQEIDLLTSLPGARSQTEEKRTGTLISNEFLCPATLDFWLCGHRGSPDQPEHSKTLVKLLSASGAELQRAYPPRNDVAQAIHWELAGQMGQPVRFVLVDGDAGAAYAWAAFGGLSPAVVPLRITTRDRALSLVAELIGSLRLAPHADRLAGALGEKLTEPTWAAIVRTVVSFPGTEKALATTLRTTPSRRQTTLAEALAGTLAGALALCDAGSPRLLLAPTVAQKLASVKNSALHERVAKLTRDLPAASAEISALITTRVATFALRGGSAEVGRPLFATHCAICHSLGGQGGLVGPQLDGCGNRGLERLCEDILDPNRDIDPLFHLHLHTLKDGSLVTGLHRREEGATIVLADVTGKEISVPKTHITRSEETRLSLMPAAFGQVMPEADFYSLLAYLLSQR
jgi:putative heme-binding domain-containing protein